MTNKPFSQISQTKISFVCRALIFLFGLNIFFVPQLSQAIAPPNYIISDADLVDADSLSLVRIQQFLSERGTLGSYTAEVDGIRKSASQIIYDIAHEYQINSKYLITRIQVEQSLITDPSPTQYQYDWATGYGRCDTCTPEQAAKYKGFALQVRWAAKRIRESYLPDLETQGHTLTGWGPGITKKTLDGVEVTPLNNATAVLYTYTPWAGECFGGAAGVGGNCSFHRIFTSWFSLQYPDGTLLQSENGGIYLIRGGEKRPFLNRAAFAPYDARKVIPVSESVLAAYTTGKPIAYPPYVLLQSPRGTVYLYNEGTIRGIQSSEVLRNLGFNPEEIITVSWNDLHNLTEERSITMQDIYPAGALLQYQDTGGVIYIDPNGTRHDIINREILQSNFQKPRILQKSREYVDQFPKGEKLGFRDGELVTYSGSRSVYLISNRTRRRFASGEVFTSLRFRWDNIITTSKEAVELHPEGEVIKLDF